MCTDRSAAVQNWEAVRPQLSALGIFDGRAGEQSMNIRLYLPQSAAAAQPTEAERWGHPAHAGLCLPSAAVHAIMLHPDQPQ